MDLLLNGSFMLGVIYSISGVAAIGMTGYLITIKGNGLKSILCHLFMAWATHYSIVGGITLASFLAGHELVPLNTLRLMASFFVLCQLIALYRLYRYIIRKN